MDASVSSETVERLAKQSREPEWLTALRRKALERHAELPWPHASDDIWRRTDVALLNPQQGGSPVAEQPIQQRMPLSEAQMATLIEPLGHEALLVRAQGSWGQQPSVPGLTVDSLERAAAGPHAEQIKQLIESDGLSESEQKLTSLNLAFHHDDLSLQVAPHRAIEQPVRLVHLTAVAAHQAVFPLSVILVGAGSSLTLIDEYVGIADDGSSQPRWVNGRIEVVLEPEARLNYIRVQRWDAQTREFLLLRSSLARHASLSLANLNLGAALSKAHLITQLSGEHASARLSGFVFGTGSQHVDQHTLQDHRAPQTTSDLQFRAALQDQSRMIYTGLIRIAKEARQTQAYQANHNLLLSQGAQAETIPMLEILADDVQCKHGASIGPIDDEQAFYLMSRGVPKEAAQRLLVMGFIEPIMQHIPFEPLQERLRQEIEGNLHHV